MLQLVPCLLISFLLQDSAATGDDDAARVATLLGEAAALEAEDRLQDAEPLLREARDVALEAELATAAVDRALGRVLYAVGDPAEGLALLYQANQEDPEHLEGALHLIDALLSERDFAQSNGEPYSAESSLQQAEQVIAPHVEASPDDRGLKLRQARVLSRTLERKEEAVPLYMQLLRETPDEQPLHQEFVKAVGDAKKFEQALGFYQGLEMDRALGLWYRGEVYVARAHHNFNRYLDDDQALHDYHEAERLILESGRAKSEWFASAGENASYHRAWAGWVLLRGEKWQDAWDHFRSALGRLPGNSSAIEGLNNLGAKFNELGQLDDARELYRQLTYHAPDRADFWNNYGLMCRDTGKYEEAFSAYRRAMKLIPDDPRVINDAALILQYHLFRDIDQAEQWLLQARDLARSNWDLAQDDAVREDQLLVYGDSLVNLWRLFDAQGRMEEASAMRVEMREADPARPELPPLPPAATDEDEGEEEDDGRDPA